MRQSHQSDLSFGALSDRERQVIGLAAAGLIDKQIGTELDVSLNTLRTYWSRIREKAGDAPRAALVAAYVREEMQKAEVQQPDPLLMDGWVLDVKSQTIMATDAINEDHELERGVPHPVKAYMGHTHPDDAAAMLQIVLDIASGKREVVHVTFRVVTARGVEVVNATIRPITNDAGEVVKVYGFRTRMLDCRPGHDPQVLVGHWEEDDYESEYFTVDEDMARILGAERPGLLSREASITWKRHPEDDEAARQACLAAIAAKEPSVVSDMRLILADGSTVWGRTKREFEYQPDGKVHIRGTFMMFK